MRATCMSKVWRTNSVVRHTTICFLSLCVLIGPLLDLVNINQKSALAMAISQNNPKSCSLQQLQILSWTRDERRHRKTKSGSCSWPFICSAVKLHDWHSCRSLYKLVTRAYSLWFLRPAISRWTVINCGFTSTSLPALGNGCPFTSLGLNNVSSCERFATSSYLL